MILATPGQRPKIQIGGEADLVNVDVFVHVLLFLSMSVNVDAKFDWFALLLVQTSLLRHWKRFCQSLGSLCKFSLTNFDCLCLTNVYWNFIKFPCDVPGLFQDLLIYVDLATVYWILQITICRLLPMFIGMTSIFTYIFSILMKSTVCPNILDFQIK